jgi:precorrin-2 dehydrogenase/sirohydrochlorin ferrochelatase
LTQLYPVMLQLHGKPCLVVGGGKVAHRKIASLLDAGAKVTVIAPEATEGIAAWAAEGTVKLVSRGYKDGDLIQLGSFNDALDVHSDKRYFLVIAAANLAEVNRQVAQEATKQGIMVNVADEPEEGSFIVPSVVRRGKLVLTVSTGGASPSAARRIAHELEDAFGEEYVIYLDVLTELRALVRSEVSDLASRREMLKAMAEWKLLALIKEALNGQEQIQGACKENAGLYFWRKEALVQLMDHPTLETVGKLGNLLDDFLNK